MRKIGAIVPPTEHSTTCASRRVFDGLPCNCYYPVADTLAGMAEKYRDALMSLIHGMCLRRPAEHPCLSGDTRCDLARRTLGWVVIRAVIENGR